MPRSTPDLGGELSSTHPHQLLTFFGERPLLVSCDQSLDYERQRAVMSIFGRPLDEGNYISNQVDSLGRRLGAGHESTFNTTLGRRQGRAVAIAGRTGPIFGGEGVRW